MALGRFWLRKKRQEGSIVDGRVSSVGQTESKKTSGLSNPVANFYENRLGTNLESFVKYALRSKSVIIRDVFAKGASESNDDLADLLVKLDNFDASRHDLHNLSETYNPRILLSLADILANTARSEFDNEASLRIYVFVLAVYGPGEFEDSQKLQYAEALVEGRRYEEFSQVSSIFRLDELDPMQMDLLQIQCIRHSASVSAWLDEMNSLYSRLGLSWVGLRKDESLPLLDRLESATDVCFSGPKISIIMPTFSPGPSIRSAVQSLLQQTWQNIEILIVDDASPFGYQALFEELEDLDSRIRVVSLTDNSGAYVARNRGLSLATGEYVTVHDDDDWSHPDKLALQVRALIEDETKVASSSAHIRTSSDLRFMRVNTKPVFMQMNYSSLMFPRSLIDEVGMWDTVNRGADGEFLLRLITNYGSARIADLSDIPLSFSRTWSGSLTSGEMSRGYFAPSRLLYREAFRHWHRETKRKKSRIFLTNAGSRNFPVPTTFESGRRNANLGSFDAVFATDFYRQSKYAQIVTSQMKLLADAGLRVGFMHLASPETIKLAGFLPELFELQLSGKLTQVSHNDLAKADLLVVYGSAIGMFLDGSEATLESRQGLVVHHELPELAGAESRTPVIFEQTLRNLDSFFKTEFQITGTTTQERNRLEQILPTERVSPESLIWYPSLSQQAQNIRTPGGTVTVGFHSYGNVYRWPATKSIFESVYHSDYYRTMFYGNVKPALKKYGTEAFDNTEVLGDKECSHWEFLQRIDFWIYYPHERLSTQLWMPVLEAMQAGAVVILPPHLEDTYGASALYAKPEEVSSIVSKLSKDLDAFSQQASLGQAFVADRYTDKRFLERYEAITSASG